MTINLISQPSIQYDDPLDGLEFFCCEAAMTIGILAGIGAPPQLHDLIDRHWLPGFLIGGALIFIGLLFIIRRYKPRFDKSFFNNIFHAFSSQRLELILHRMYNYLRRQLYPNRNAVEVDIPATSTAIPSPLKESPDSPPTTAIILLPFLVILIGLFIAAPTAMVTILQVWKISNLDLLAVYFSAPAILFWIIGELVYFFPRITIKPKHLAEYAGLLKSVIQIFSALFLWSYLGLSITNEGFEWMFWAALCLGIAGLLLGLVSNYYEAQRQEPPKIVR